jgi:hypothetical protein
MATPAPRRRRSASASPSDTVKTSLSLARDLSIRIDVAAKMRGLSMNAYMIEVLTESTRGLVIHDRRKGSDRLVASESAILASQDSESDES